MLSILIFQQPPWLLFVLAASLLFAQETDAVAPVFCEPDTDCYRDYAEPCQEIIARSFDWDGCCSFLDIDNTDDGFLCRLMVVDSCSFSSYSRTGRCTDLDDLTEVDADIECLLEGTLVMQTEIPEDLTCPSSVYGSPFPYSAVFNNDNDESSTSGGLILPPFEETLPPSDTNNDESSTSGGLILPPFDETLTPSGTNNNGSDERTEAPTEFSTQPDSSSEGFDIIQIGGCDANDHFFRGVNSVLLNLQDSSFSRASITVSQECVSNARGQLDLLQRLAAAGEPQSTKKGVLLSVSSAELLTPVIDELVDMGITVVTFESDAPDSKRSAFVGTNNTFMGDQIARNVEQILPNGGTYAIVASPSEKNIQRIDAFQARLEAEGGWKQISGSPLYEELLQDNYTHNAETFRKMQTLMDQNPTVFVPMELGYMESLYWMEWVDGNRFRNVTYVSGDGTPIQLSFLLRNYAQGLVGQIPYEMGVEGVRTLLAACEGKAHDQFIGTNVIAHTKIPYVLPQLNVDHNLLEGLKFVGYVCFAVVALCCIAVSIWAYRLRDVYVVRASQPVFLIMVAGGVFILSSALIPLSMDDASYIYGENTTHSTGICMSIPWLACTGYTATFAAMFSKTWRINRLMNNGSGFRRVAVKERDVLVPFVALLTVNFTVLLVWTIVDPLRYERNALPGTDGWNRVIATYGACRSDSPAPYLSALLIVNMSVLAISNWQAYRARKLESEFAESKYIGFTMASLFQAKLIGLPTLFLVRENPQAFYLLLVFLIFVICMVTLLLIFVPKMVFAQTFQHMPPSEQACFMRERIRMSSQPKLSQGLSSKTKSGLTSGSFDAFTKQQSTQSWRGRSHSSGTHLHSLNEAEITDGQSDTDDHKVAKNADAQSDKDGCKVAEKSVSARIDTDDQKVAEKADAQSEMDDQKVAEKEDV